MAFVGLNESNFIKINQTQSHEIDQTIEANEHFSKKLNEIDWNIQLYDTQFGMD